MVKRCLMFEYEFGCTASKKVNLKGGETQIFRCTYTCVNNFEIFKDVLVIMQNHPQTRILWDTVFTRLIEPFCTCDGA